MSDELTDISMLTSPSAVEARLHEAIQLARVGKTNGLARLAVIAAEKFSSDPGILHSAGVVMRFCGNGEEALRLFSRALEAQPHFHFSEIEIGVIFAEAGEKETALDWFRRAIASAPDYPVAYIRAAILERELGRSWDALQLLEELHRHQPDDIEANILRGSLLQYHNDRPAAARAYAEAINAGCSDPDVHYDFMRLRSEIADYQGVLAHAEQLNVSTAPSSLAIGAAAFSGNAKLALVVDTERLVSAAQQRERSEQWLGVEALVERLKAAIHARTPLSMIRLGDGEARFLCFFDKQARDLLSQAEAESILNLVWDNWFGQSIKEVGPAGMAALAERFRTALFRAEILGVNTAERLAADKAHRGFLGVMERVIGEIVAAHPEVRLTGAFANLDLHRRSPFYAEILCGVDFLGVISPHPGLAERLAHRHCIAAFEDYVVPGESRLPEAVQGRHSARHFPNRFLEVVTGLRVPQPGAVFLVAAGLLGKIYCEHVRSLGGIALDIGSIADAWMGYNTRPGYFDQPDEWRLPER